MESKIDWYHINKWWGKKNQQTNERKKENAHQTFKTRIRIDECYFCVMRAKDSSVNPVNSKKELYRNSLIEMYYIHGIAFIKLFSTNIADILLGVHRMKMINSEKISCWNCGIFDRISMCFFFSACIYVFKSINSRLRSSWFGCSKKNIEES